MNLGNKVLLVNLAWQVLLDNLALLATKETPAHRVLRVILDISV